MTTNCPVCNCPITINGQYLRCDTCCKSFKILDGEPDHGCCIIMEASQEAKE